MFEGLPFLYQSAYSECKGISRASSDLIIDFSENKLAPNR